MGLRATKSRDKQQINEIGHMTVHPYRHSGGSSQGDGTTVISRFKKLDQSEANIHHENEVTLIMSITRKNDNHWNVYNFIFLTIPDQAMSWKFWNNNCWFATWYSAEVQKQVDSGVNREDISHRFWNRNSSNLVGGNDNFSISAQGGGFISWKAKDGRKLEYSIHGHLLIRIKTNYSSNLYVSKRYYFFLRVRNKGLHEWKMDTVVNSDSRPIIDLFTNVTQNNNFSYFS